MRYLPLLCGLASCGRSNFDPVTDAGNVAASHIAGMLDDVRYTSQVGEEVTSDQCAAGTAISGSEVFGSGFRYRDVTVPPAATILSAHLTFIAREDQSNTPVDTKLSGQRDAAPVEFGLGDFASRPRTISVTQWHGIPPWTTGASYDSPDLTTIVQELVDLPGWTGTLVLFWEDDGTTLVDHQRVGYSFDTAPAQAPVLVIAYR